MPNKKSLAGFAHEGFYYFNDDCMNIPDLFSFK